MSVRPVSYDPSGGVTVWHDEMGHGGAVAFAQIVFGRRDDGSVDPTLLVLPCPVPGCNGSSVHPIGGGAAAGLVQKLFLRTILRRAAALGIAATFAAAKLRVRQLVVQEDGLDRFRLGAMQAEDDEVAP
jgi:hypothetical protein